MTKNDTGIPLPPQIARLKGRFSPAARERISEFLASFKSFEPTLGLLYGDVDAGANGGPSWSITAFAPQTVDDMMDMYGSFGAVVCYELDGFRVLVPQMSHIAELDGGELDFTGDRLRPVVPAAG